MRSHDGPRPLGPDSLTWKYFGDWRGLLQGPWAGTVQNMHPKLGAAVTDHSVFFTERWQRLMRSTYPITGVVFDQDRAIQTAHEVRGYHDAISGVDKHGRPYHALDPDVFYWAHATFFMGLVITVERFMGGLTLAQKRQLFDEHVQWYRLYGVSMRPVPESWEAFQEYWDHMCRDVLEDNEAAREVLDLRSLDKPPQAPWLPDIGWAVLRPAVAVFFEWLTVGMLDEPLRRKLGYDWNVVDEFLLGRVGDVVRLVDPFVPRRHRKQPRANAAFDRVAGRKAPDSPLPQTPSKYLAPQSERNDPKHYNPARA